MCKVDKSKTLSAVLGCVAAVFAASTLYLYSTVSDLNAQLDQSAADLAAAQSADTQSDSLAAQVQDLQSQLDAEKAAYNELSNEKSSVEDLTQQAYEEGWNDACYEYDLEPNSDDIPAYDYVAEIDKDNSPTAYITPSGNRYHLSQSCAGENAIKTTIADASDKGYTPCAKCAQ